MEVYTLDPLFRREFVVDRFESLIWTDRLDTPGDFQLEVHSTPANRRLFRPGRKLAMNESHHVMTVETFEDSEDEEGRPTLSLKGRSLETILMERSTEAMNVTAPPGDIIRWTVEDAMILTTRPEDVVPFFSQGSFLPNSTIPEPQDDITIQLEHSSVYDTIQPIANVWGFGFHILRNGDASELLFNAFMGSDRTSGQATHAPVIFSKDFDNLMKTKELLTIEDARNVAYVFSYDAMEVVYADGVDPADATGFDRRVLTVVADDIEQLDPDRTSKMIQRGKEALAKQRMNHIFDGEISQTSQYRYQRDYWMGDYVEMRSKDGNVNTMRVTEQIFVSDREGERSYPTLTLHRFITPGSWLGWQYNKTWPEFDETEFWSNQP